MEELGKKLGVSNDRFQRRLEEAKESDPTNAAAKIPEKDLLNGEAFWSDLVYQTQRIKISLGETARNELVERVEKLNSQLRNILKVSDEITTAERSAAARKNSSLPKAMLSFWRNADKVYALLKTAWQCTCVSMHSAHLLLENRTYQKIDLSIALMYGTGVLEGATPSWAWHDTVIVMADKQALPSLNTSTVAPPTLPHPTGPKGWSSHPLRSAMRRSGGKQKSVKLAPVSNVPVPQQLSAADAPPGSVSETQEIKQLCTTIAGHPAIMTCIGCLRDIEEDNQYYISSRGSRDRKLITLHRLLEKSSPLKLDRCQRYAIAWTISSAHVQLHSSAWLKTKWSSNDIIFLSYPNDSEKFLLDRPFLSRDFCETAAGPIQAQPRKDETFLT